ncbi:MAG: primosomal protein N', partial [Ruminococcus sp.]
NASKKFMEMFVENAKTSYEDLPLRILGPSPASVAKVSNKYRYKIIIKCRNQKRFRKLLSDTVLEFNSLKEYKDVIAYVDMNALSL